MRKRNAGRKSEINHAPQVEKPFVKTEVLQKNNAWTFIVVSGMRKRNAGRPSEINHATQAPPTTASWCNPPRAVEPHRPSIIAVYFLDIVKMVPRAKPLPDLRF